jgi:hypothetical protein
MQAQLYQNANTYLASLARPSHQTNPQIQTQSQKRARTREIMIFVALSGKLG